MENILGKEVVNVDGQKISVSSIAKPGKIIGLYFSAHWCPPCRGFTPQLATFYNKMKHDKGADAFEIIFVSSDKDDAQFHEYFKEMPWLALPYTDRNRKQILATKYGVTGIPMLVLLDGSSGEVIVPNARMNVVQDPNGAHFPWH